MSFKLIALVQTGQNRLYLRDKLPRSMVCYESDCSNQLEETPLSYDFAVIQWITSCDKNRMTTRVITFWRVDITSLATSVSTMRFLLEVLPILKAIKSNFKGSYDKQNLTRVIISYEISETRQSLVT